MKPIEADWILQPGRIEPGGWCDPDMAHRQGVKRIKPPSTVKRLWRKFEAWLKDESELERAIWRGCCRLVDVVTPKVRYAV